MPEEVRGRKEVTVEGSGENETAATALRWLRLSALVLFLDQGSKILAEHYLTRYQSVPLLPHFDLTLLHNRGMAFSFLADAGGWQRWFLVILSTIITVLLLQWLRRLESGSWLLAAALAMIVGGALGNLIDRIQYGYVIDFIDLHYQGWHWPAFNIADSAIFVGAVLLIVSQVVEKRDDERAAQS